MFRYEISPIDYFDGCVTLAEYIISMTEKADDDYTYKAVIADLNKEICVLVTEMSKMELWDGDIREGIYVFAVPDDTATKIGFIWKHDNNGCTFVISPIELPHLNQLSLNI
jgi:hypothetical protein